MCAAVTESSNNPLERPAVVECKKNGCFSILKSRTYQAANSPLLIAALIIAGLVGIGALGVGLTSFFSHMHMLPTQLATLNTLGAISHHMTLFMMLGSTPLVAAGILGTFLLFRKLCCSHSKQKTDEIIQPSPEPIATPADEFGPWQGPENEPLFPDIVEDQFGPWQSAEMRTSEPETDATGDDTVFGPWQGALPSAEEDKTEFGPWQSAPIHSPAAQERTRVENIKRLPALLRPAAEKLPTQRYVLLELNDTLFSREYLVLKDLPDIHDKKNYAILARSGPTYMYDEHLTSANLILKKQEWDSYSGFQQVYWD